MTEKVLIVKYGEIAMRGNNKYLFINRLIYAIRRNLKDYGDYYVIRDPGRLIVVDKGGELDYDLTVPLVQPIFGLGSICPGVCLQTSDYEEIKTACLEHMKEFYADKPTTFKVQTRRANKSFEMPSLETNMEIGGYLLENMENLTVNVKTPDVVLNVELRNNVYIHSKTVKAYGGLPYGSSGKGISLLSGGIDSPVATWLMAKRGLEVEGVYFHSPPYTSEWAKEKVIDLAKRIADFTGEFKLHIVNFTELQLYLLENTAHDKLTIYLKRAMMRAGEMIAEKEDALSLITGESVGQVASQTMHGIHAINAVCNLPVLRPLAGMDKQEIIDIARKIDTYDISVRPYEDCCTVFVAKHPVTKPRLKYIEKGEQKLTELDRLLDECVQNAEVLKL